MTPKNRAKLTDRVSKAAETALAAQHYVSPVDVLVGIGWLDPGTVKRWRQGQIDCLERVVQTNLPRISEVMRLFGSWAAGKGLFASETGLCGAHAAATEVTLQPEREPDDRTTVPDPLGFARAFRAEARALGGKGKPCTGAGGDPAIEH